MRKELFLNGQSVDLPNDFRIGLNFGCSDVSNLNNINSDYSSTIKLPNTTKNNRIIELSCYPVSGSVLPYNYVAASYYINGVPIFENGRAVISEQFDGISINLFWSVFSRLKDLESLKLTDLNIAEGFLNNYKSTAYNGTYLEQLIADFGNTFSRGVARRNVIAGNRFFPTFKVKSIFDLILGGVGSYVMPTPVANHLNSLRMCTATMKGNSSITAITKIQTRHDILGGSNLIPIGSTSFVLHYLDAAGIISDGYNLLKQYDFEGGIGTNIPANARFMAAPAKGRYRVHGSLAINPNAFVNTTEYIHVIMKVVGLNEGVVLDDETIEPDETLFLEVDFGERNSYPSGYPILIEFDETIDLPGSNQTLRIEFHSTTNIPAGRAARPVLGDYSGAGCGVYLTRVNISYVDSNNNIGFLMDYPAKENLPDMSQKDFIKSIMQLYGLMLVIKDDKPYFFRFEDVIENKSIAKDWTSKLVNNKNQLIPSKMQFDIGVAKNNYLKYAKDELVNELTGNGNILSNYSIVDSIDLVQQSKFTASEETSISDGYTQTRAILMQQFENKDGKITYAGKAKLRLGYVYDCKKLTFNYKNIYNEDSFDKTIELRKAFRFIGDYHGAGLDYSFDLIPTFFAGYESVIQSGKKLVLKFRLNSIDLHEFDYTIPIWLSQFNRFYFVKKITNWDIGVDCEVELIQLP